MNAIIKGKDNPVRIAFSGVALSSFDRIELTVSTETYSTDTTPDALSVDSDVLVVSIGDVTALDSGTYYPEIVGYSAQYNDGFILSGSKLPILPMPIVIK